MAKDYAEKDFLNWCKQANIDPACPQNRPSIPVLAQERLGLDAAFFMAIAQEAFCSHVARSGRMSSNEKESSFLRIAYRHMFRFERERKIGAVQAPSTPVLLSRQEQHDELVDHFAQYEDEPENVSATLSDAIRSRIKLRMMSPVDQRKFITRFQHRDRPAWKRAWLKSRSVRRKRYPFGR